MITTTREREKERQERGFSPRKKYSWPTITKKNHNILGVTTKNDEIYT
jgi:hypothetical protein